MRRTLITGGAGFIGSHLVDCLIAKGNDHVTVLDNFSDFYDPAIKRTNVSAHLKKNSRFELVEGDICDDVLMKEMFARSRFDCVVHLAARAGVSPSLEHPLAYEKTNVRGTYSVLEAARASSTRRFIFASSSSVYGLNSTIPFVETDPLIHPISPYAATKIAGESACRVYSHLCEMRVICLRFFTAYGARQRPDLAIHKFARLMTEGKPIPVYGDGTTKRDYTYIDDIVAGTVAAMESEGERFDVFNLGESRAVELNYLISLLEQALGVKAVIDWRPPQPGDVPITFADIGKAGRLLGYDPQTPIETGIEKFAAWFKSRSA